MNLNSKNFLDRRLFLFLVFFIFLHVLTVIFVPMDFLKVSLILVACMTFILLYFFIIHPYRRAEKHLAEYAAGYTSSLPGGPFTSRAVAEALEKLHNDSRATDAVRSATRHAEFLALQNQINPHFLYNTLEGIRSDALMEGADTIAEIVESLAVYFRYTISRTNHLVTLRQELANIQNYLNIQNYRFDNRIKLQIETQEAHSDVENCLLPKLTLQPFVENAIIHGLEGQIEGGTIIIRSGSTEKILHIDIEDDGVGIAPEILQNIHHNLYRLSDSVTSNDSDIKNPSAGGIAIRNVNNRIKLLFGDKYGVKLRSLPKVGTSVHITLPLRWNPTHAS